MLLYTLTDPQLNPGMARTLSRSDKAEVRRAIAGNPNAPADALLSLLAEFPDEVLQNASLPLLLLEDPTLLHNIQADSNEKLARILFHESFPAELRDGVFLSTLGGLWHPQSFLGHPRCPKRLLLLGLRTTSSARLKNYLFLALLHHAETTEQDLLAHGAFETNTRVALARCKITPSSLLGELLVDRKEEVRAMAAMNPKAPREILSFLYQAGASGDLRRFTKSNTLTPKELSRLRIMGPFGEALWVRHPSTPVREARFRYEPLWLAALATRPDLPQEERAKIKEWARSRRRRVKHVKEELRSLNKAETQKRNQKKGKVSIRPSWR